MNVTIIIKNKIKFNAVVKNRLFFWKDCIFVVNKQNNHPPLTLFIRLIAFALILYKKLTQLLKKNATFSIGSKSILTIFFRNQLMIYKQHEENYFFIVNRS